ncbi:DUF3182 family protein [Labrys okinawensis]|uniref:DUF3182 family protein n=1 Tax=Labrys okinawensis TaxID=346911 RepID=UPI001AEC98C6|nr:DUF3182 family protein [Labrys okinawensis]
MSALTPDQCRQVLIYAPEESEFTTQHERAGRVELARQLGALKGFEFGGLWDQSHFRQAKPYFLPSKALRPHEAIELGVSSVADLYGGVVPHDFVATKAITHGLITPCATAPAGWSHAFSTSVQEVVLPGISAFSAEDGMAAGLALLKRHPVRCKPANATGGRGQAVVRTMAQLVKYLGAMGEDEIATHGVVLEENLSQVQTWSVGVVEVGDIRASYYGLQRMTRDNRGRNAYGGSSLVFARGGFDDLLGLDITVSIRAAIDQARHYDQTAFSCFPGLIASRRNYDVVQGLNGQGQWQSGVLEQSWRVGGASSAEVAALQIFQARPKIGSVRASSVEVYGNCTPPPGAVVYFHGHDADAGPITKYSIVEKNGHADV